MKDTSNKNMPTNKPSKMIGGNIEDHSGVLPHAHVSANVGTSASPELHTGQYRQAKMSPSAQSMKMRNAANNQTSQTSDWSFPG